MTAVQKLQLKELYAAGPRAAGLETDKWTTLKLTEVIYKQFSIAYDPDHVCRIIHKLGLRGRIRQRREKAVSFPILEAAANMPEPSEMRI